MDSCRDLIEWLGPDASSVVLSRLDDPGDVVRASAVSRFWHRLVVTNGLCKKLCLRKFPEASIFSSVAEVSRSSETDRVGSSTVTEFEILQGEHRVYSYLSHCLVSGVAEKDCIGQCIEASSTDNYPFESIENTLEPRDEVGGRPSYWSSKGTQDPSMPEMLTYRLISKLLVVTEICLQPFKAFFQYGHPIYSARYVRFRMGYKDAKANNEDVQTTSQKLEVGKYVWTYVSPEFPMVQENVMQYFKLPRPVICTGGIVQVELLGRVQKQAIDDLYYICMNHVKVIGHSLSPTFDFGLYGTPVLKYFPDSKVRPTCNNPVADETTFSGWQHSLAERIRKIRGRAWNRVIMRTARGEAPSSDPGNS